MQAFPTSNGYPYGGYPMMGGYPTMMAAPGAAPAATRDIKEESPENKEGTAAVPQTGYPQTYGSYPYGGYPTMGRYSTMPMAVPYPYPNAAPINTSGDSGAAPVTAPVTTAPYMAHPMMSLPNAEPYAPGSALSPQECMMYGVPMGATWGAGATSSTTAAPAQEEEFSGTQV